MCDDVDLVVSMCGSVHIVCGGVYLVQCWFGKLFCVCAFGHLLIVCFLYVATYSFLDVRYVAAFLKQLVRS